MTFTKLPPVEHPKFGCVNCGPPSVHLPLDAALHPGFGDLTLFCDGEVPEFWSEFRDWPVPEYLWGSWETGEIKVGPRKGQEWHAWIGGIEWQSLIERVQLFDIEEAVAEDPDHDWQVEIYGPMHGETYQRQGPGHWVMVKTNGGFEEC